MSHKFGEIRQMAFVVPDIDKAMQYWTKTLGIGPFFVKRRLQFSRFVYRGSSAVSPVVSIALANSGYMQIELIQQHDETPSIYKEFLDAGREGLQHVSSWLTHGALQERRRELLAQGAEIAQECVIPSSGVTLVYFDTNSGGEGLIFEMSDLMEPIHRERIEGIEKAARDWDGQAPIREVTT